MNQSYAARAIAGRDAARAAVRERPLNRALEARRMIFALALDQHGRTGVPYLFGGSKANRSFRINRAMRKMAKSKAKQSQPEAKSRCSKSFRIRGG